MNNSKWLLMKTSMTILFIAMVYCLSFAAIDSTGCYALMNADFRTAIKTLEAQKNITDSLYWHFKLGVAYANRSEYKKSTEHYLKSTATPSLLRGIGLANIGDNELAQNHESDAVNAYFAALRDTLTAKNRQAIFDKLYSIVTKQPRIVAAYPELAAMMSERKVLNLQAQSDDSAKTVVDSLISQGAISRIDTLFDSILQSQKYSLADKIITGKCSDSALSTIHLFLLAKVALQGKKYALADSLLDRCEKRSGFAKEIPESQYVPTRGLVYAGCGKHGNAVLYLLKAEKQFGATPEIILALGRSNRSLGNDEMSQRYYKKFAALFPKHQSTVDILWYIAWEDEAKGNYKLAIQEYERISKTSKNNSRSDESFYRIGLCYYKNQQYINACSTFAKLPLIYDDSPFMCSALYWKGKSLEALGEQAKAVDAFFKAMALSPTDFYAFRAREMLIMYGASEALFCPDTTFDKNKTRVWLDSLSPKTGLSVADSQALSLGTMLAYCGLVSQASQYTAGLDTRYPANLVLQFDLASLYDAANNTTLSYKIGRKLGWRIPASSRNVMPLPIFNILYPLPFLDVVYREAKRNAIDPFFVFAVMRQESIFDPLIGSRVGAIGLMQIMPATGLAISKSLGEPFSADSLFNPSINIRQGAFYLKELLDQFKGNMVLVLASYNGGPPKAMEWFEKNKRKSFDLFIEDIGFSETRGYVKKVLANYWTYRRFCKSFRID